MRRPVVLVLLALGVAAGCGARPGPAPTSYPTAACALLPVVGRLQGDPALPDQIQVVQHSGELLTLTDPRDLFDFVFDPDLRVVRRDSGETVATAGNEYEIGFEGRGDGSFGLCGDFTPRSRGLTPTAASSTPGTAPTPQPTGICVGDPVTGRISGDPDEPDRIFVTTRDGTVLTLIDARDYYDFVFDPTLRVVFREGGWSVAREGLVYELGYEIRPDGTNSLCAGFTGGLTDFPRIPATPTPRAS